MIYTINLEDIQNNCIYYGVTEKNNIVSNCLFTQLLYSTMKYTLTYIIVDFFLENVTIIDTDDYYLINIKHDNPYNVGIIHRLQKLEEHILYNYNNKKTFEHQTTLKNSLNTCVLKLRKTNFMNTGKHDKIQIYLKISGVWENINNKIGIIYKLYTGKECISLFEYVKQLTPKK